MACDIDTYKILKTRRYLKIRRIFEISLIIVSFPVTLPVLLITSIAVKLDIKKNILFVQPRPGINSEYFSIYKFRTMKDISANIHESEKNDLRISRTGHFIRRHRLDELPQIFNVLKGDLAIIGPRPDAHFFYELVVGGFPEYKNRHLICPGLTGWAQVNFKHTDNLDDAITKYEYDIWYINNASLLVDLKILFKTFGVIFNGTGAR